MIDENELLTFFKALSDANRLKIVGLLARQSYTVEQLAAMLGLGASTVSHHLSRLSEAGLVTATARSYYNDYQLKTEKIEKVAHLLLDKETLLAAAGELDNDAQDRTIVSHYLLPNGQLKTIPAQQKKLYAVLRHIVRDFEPGRRYSEKDVNEKLARYHADTASLRRELISARLMDRESSGGAYWRVEDRAQKSL
jgi:predicted transcriptional regulator